MTQVAIYFVLGLASSLALTPICRVVARRFGYVAKPRADRWHSRPTALFGGVAIVVTTLGLAATIGGDRSVLLLAVCSAMIAAFGLMDDILPLKPSTKLIAQICVAAALLFYGLRLQWTESMIGDAMLTLFFVVGVTNAFNLLDNMDGLCAGTALIAGTCLMFALAGQEQLAGPALYLAALLGATGGFLVYNLHPASIFMGDTGSLFLGLNLAALTLLVQPESISRSGLLPIVAAPVLPLLIPIFDTTLVTGLRLLSRRSPSQGGRDHTSHRLVTLGLSEPRAVATLWALAAAGGMTSVLLQRPDQGLGTVAAALFLLGMIIFGVFLARIRVYDDADLAVLKGETFTPIVANFMYKRRVAEVLLDLCLIPLAYYTAYRLRFEGPLLAPNYPYFIQSLPVVLGAQLVALFLMGGYRGTWRYFGMMDAVVFAKSVVLGTVMAQVGILYLYRYENYSRAVFVIYAATLFLLLAATRASFRLVGEFVVRRTAVGRRCVIYGAHGASLATIREAFGPEVVLKVLGYIDDDPMQRNLRVGGYGVLGNHSHLLSMIEQNEVDCVVINTHLVDAERLQHLDVACRKQDVDLLRLHVHLRRLPAVS